MGAARSFKVAVDQPAERRLENGAADASGPKVHCRPQRSDVCGQDRRANASHHGKSRCAICSDRNGYATRAATGSRVSHLKGVFMSALQTYLSNHRAKPGPQPLRVNVRKRKTRRNSARISASPRLEKAVAPQPVSEEWTLIQRAIAGNSSAQQLIFSRYTAKLQRSAFAILHNKRTQRMRYKTAFVGPMRTCDRFKEGLRFPPGLRALSSIRL